MRVAFPLGGTDWGRSGIGTYVKGVLPRMARRLAAQGDSLVAIGNAAELQAYAAILAGVEQVRVAPLFNRPGPSALWYLAEAGRQAARAGADVVFYPAAQRRFSVLRPLPSVAVMHDLGQLNLAGKYDPLRMFYFKRLMLPLVGQATRLVAVSASTRDDMVRHMGLSPAAIAVIPLGVEVERFRPLAGDSPEVQQARQETGLPQRYLLYPSRLEHPAKNHLRLIQAFASSPLRHSHVLAFAGGDWGGEPLIREELRRHGLESRVKLLGYVSDASLAGLFAAADAVIMVGLTEGFGLPALEALSAGRAVCAANAGALPEVVGPLASLCDPLSVPSIAQALERAVGDVTLRERAAIEGPRWAAARSWERTADALVIECSAAAATRRSAGRSGR
jgi:glycosyltransferase involved in cell wall biosynthesis